MLEWASRRNRSFDTGGAGGTVAHAPEKAPRLPKKSGIALALGGGAARGWAHIVLRWTRPASR